MNTDKGKITYRQLTISTQEAQQIATTLGFNESGRNWYVYRVPHLDLKRKQRFENVGMQAYMPTYTVRRAYGTKVITTEKPKTLNYLFVLATTKQISDLYSIDEITPLQRHRCEGEIFNEKDRWIIIPPSQMHSLMIVTQGYEQEVEFTTPDQQRLSKGDLVRVVGGRFQGVEGILVKNQGDRSGGRIYVEVTRHFGTRTMAIPDEHIQVLEFAHGTNHFYYQIQAIEKQLNAICERRQQSLAPLPEQNAALEFFLFRYSELRNLTYVNLAKLTACRYAALFLLNRRTEAAALMQQYLEQQQQSKASRRAARRSPSAANYIESWHLKLQSLFQQPKAV